jgi:iron(III) transport system ATP-binding protein
VQTVEVRDGRTTLAGHAVTLAGSTGPGGVRQAMFRPADLAIVAPGEGAGLQGRVTSALYRGGHWEARVALPGLDEPFLVHADAPLRVGDELALRLRGGWLLPEA